MKTFPSLRLLALASALALGGCNLFDEKDSKRFSWVGLPLDSLRGASALELHGDRLFVANRSATAPGVAAIDTATGLIAEYYGEAIPPSALAITAGGHLVVTETNYVEGGVSVIDPGTKTIRKSVISFGSDNGAAAADGKVFLFNRTTGVVTGFTGDTPGANVVFDAQAGTNANPYDIAVAGGKAYVTRYNLSSLLIFNDADQLGGGARDSIDLLAYSKDTVMNIPYMAQVAASGGYVFVTLQRWIAQYPRDAALDTAAVLVINAATKAVENVIPLHFRNPTSARVVDGIWYISCVGEYLANDGGVEKIDLAARTHAGEVVTEAALGGDVSGYVPVNGGGYVSYSTDYFTTIRVKKIAP